MTETTPKRPGRKRLSKDGVIMSERVSMSCTPDELAMLQEAVKLSERDNVSAFMRSIIVPAVRNLVTNDKMAKVAEQLTNPTEYAKMIANGFDIAMTDEKVADVLLSKEAIAALNRFSSNMELERLEAMAKRSERRVKQRKVAAAK